MTDRSMCFHKCECDLCLGHGSAYEGMGVTHQVEPAPLDKPPAIRFYWKRAGDSDATE